MKPGYINDDFSQLVKEPFLKAIEEMTLEKALEYVQGLKTRASLIKRWNSTPDKSQFQEGEVKMLQDVCIVAQVLEVVQRKQRLPPAHSYALSKALRQLPCLLRHNGHCVFCYVEAR